MFEIEKIKKSSQKKLYLKIAFILVLILLLMIPNAFVKDLIRERQALEYQVQSEISKSWGPEQTLIGPILSIPFTVDEIQNDKKIIVPKVLRIVPDSMVTDVDLKTQIRKKGIYKAILYNAAHDITGVFKLPELKDFGENVNEIFYDKSTLDLGFSSASSLDNMVAVKWNGENYKMQSGASDNNLLVSAIHALVPLDKETSVYSFSIDFGINGTRNINYLPLAANATLKMTGDWADPGFIGFPIPLNREISNDGFTAEWKATEYNRPFKKMWQDNNVRLGTFLKNKTFGVSLIQTVSHYQKNMRSAKYALLIISMSFLVFFFFEFLKGHKVHPVQYMFIGLALSVFYFLLLSFSEHVGFNIAYAIAAVSTVSLMSWYSLYILGGIKKVMILAFILLGLYAYIYTLLQMEDFALLVGSVGLFFALTITMYLSRNADWYGEDKI